MAVIQGNSHEEFIDCYKNHVKFIIDNKNNLNNFVPSAMVLDMHLKRFDAYTKAYKNILNLDKPSAFANST